MRNTAERVRREIGEDTRAELIRALCADYGRRERLIREGGGTPREKCELRYYNYKIYEAVAEIGGDERAETFISEICSRLGYAHSSLEDMSESTYKRYKALMCENIAHRLFLC